MEAYSHLWDPLPAIEEIYEPYNNFYAYVSSLFFKNYGLHDHIGTHIGLENYGLHDHVDTDLGLTFVHENMDDYGFDDPISSMNPIGTPPNQVSIDDYNVCGNDDEVMFLYEIKARPQLSHNYPLQTLNSNSTNFDQGLEDETFLDGVDDEIAQLCSPDTSNATMENPSTVNPELLSSDTHGTQLDEIPKYSLSYGAEAKQNQYSSLIMHETWPTTSQENKETLGAQGRSQKIKVMKVVGAGEEESDEWAWKKYGTKKRITRS